jgi:hypothetical protein
MNFEPCQKRALYGFGRSKKRAKPMLSNRRLRDILARRKSELRRAGRIMELSIKTKRFQLTHGLSDLFLRIGTRSMYWNALHSLTID